MSFIRRWLDLAGGRRGPTLRPHRDVVLGVGYDEAYDRALDAFETVLGANVAIADRAAGTIEASFGLVNSERIRCFVRRESDGTSAVRVEAYFPAGGARERSAAVDAFADALERPRA